MADQTGPSLLRGNLAELLPPLQRRTGMFGMPDGSHWSLVIYLAGFDAGSSGQALKGS
jgi:hypothetical protein